MPKSSRDSLKNKGKKDLPTFDPEDLVLVTDEKHPLYDERVHLPVDERMVLNMMHVVDGAPQGVLEAITIARNTENGQLEVVIGRQRVKAAREANKRLKKAGADPFWIPALVQRVSANRGMAMIISENEIRQDDTPLGRAKKMQRYLALGNDEEGVSKLFGISLPSVKNILSLLDAPAAVRNAVESGKISTSDGYKLAKLEPDAAKEKVAELIENAPRTPGKKRSGNAKKAREIVTGSKELKISKKAEDSVATDIAAWIDANYEISEPFPDLVKSVRSGKWRAIRGE